MKLPLPLLIDFDGVINLYGEPAPGSKEFLNFIVKNQLPAFILSNSTLKISKDIKEFLINKQLSPEIPVMTAADAALKYVENNYKRISVYCVDKVKKEFEKFIDDDDPQAIVVGDMGDMWSIEIINEIFQKVHRGTDLIAMHMNRYWSPQKDKLILDAGSYLSAVEYATSKKATLIGKPSPIFFQTALQMLGYSKEASFLMLGDDLESDISPVQTMGSKAILILTGKTKFPPPPDSSIVPDFIAKDLLEVLEILRDFYSLH
jgi:HAD superfamily hydrolase (TIGR01458 family)